MPLHRGPLCVKGRSDSAEQALATQALLEPAAQAVQTLPGQNTCPQARSAREQDAFFRFLVCVEDGLFGWLDSDKLLAACADTASLNATAVGDCADGDQGAAQGGRW